MAMVREIRDMAQFFRDITGRVRKATARALVKTVNAASNKAKRNEKERFHGSADRPLTGNLLNAIFAGFQLAGTGQNKTIGTGMVAVRSNKGQAGTRPYGRIHEYGGTIRPRKAKFLWLPMFGPKSTGDKGNFRDITPREFMKGIMEQRKKRIFNTRSTKAGANAKGFNYKGRSKKPGGGSKPTVKSLMGSFAFINSDEGLIAGFDKVSGRGKTERHKWITLFLLRKKVEIPAKRYVNDAVDEEFPQFKRRLAIELGEA